MTDRMPITSNPGILLSAAMFTGLMLFSGCSTAPDLETSRRFQQAEETFATAKTSDQFLQAAAQYQEILDGGFASGSVFYNQGNAWMQANEVGRAIVAYRNAQRSLPRDPYLAANLRQALTKTGKPAEGQKSLIDYLFFWQNSISYLEKTWIVTGLLLAVLLMALAAQGTRYSKELKRLNIVILVAFVLMAGSLARDWTNFELSKHGAIITDTTARKGGSESYEPAFNQSLTDGTEFTVKSEQNGWLHIDVAGAGEGWIPERNGVVY